MAFNIVKNCDGIVLSYSLILYVVFIFIFKFLIATTVIIPFIQDILKLFNDCLAVNKKVV